MLRALFQLVVIAGGVALGMSKLDSSTMKRIEDSMREFAGAVGWREATTPHPEAQTVQPGGLLSKAGVTCAKRRHRPKSRRKPSTAHLWRTAIGRR